MDEHVANGRSADARGARGAAVYVTFCKGLRKGADSLRRAKGLSPTSCSAPSTSSGFKGDTLHGGLQERQWHQGRRADNPQLLIYAALVVRSLHLPNFMQGVAMPKKVQIHRAAAVPR
jgi:hypothetical protein